MAMGTTQAFVVPNGYLFRVHLDTAKTIEVIPAVLDEEGAEVTPAVYGPDPAWLFERTWGKEEAPVTQEQHLAKYKVEFELLAADELARLAPPEEVSLPI